MSIEGSFECWIILEAKAFVEVWGID